MFVERYLNQLKTLRYQIKCKESDAEMWRNMATSLQSYSDGDRVQKSTTQDRMADAIAKAVDCETDARALLMCLVDLQKTILWQIDHMDSDMHRLILYEYYVHEKTLAEISDEWKRSYRHVRRIKAAALHAFADKYRGNF